MCFLYISIFIVKKVWFINVWVNFLFLFWDFMYWLNEWIIVLFFNVIEDEKIVYW